MNQRYTAAPAHQKDSETFKDPVAHRNNMDATPRLKNTQPGPTEQGTTQDQASTSLGASRTWIKTSLPSGESQDDQEEDAAHFYASSVPVNYYPPYGPPAFYGAGPVAYYGPPQGNPAYGAPEYAPRGYPVHMMSPHSRHALYSQRQAPPHYYYDHAG